MVNFFILPKNILKILPSHIEPWFNKIDQWRTQLPDDIPPVPTDEAGYVDAHHFVSLLSNVLAEDEIIFVDTGGNLIGHAKYSLV